MKTLTSGERMVWAAEFVAAVGRGENFATAATCAADLMGRLRGSIGAGDLNDEVRAMFEDMIAPDVGLFCVSGALGMFEPGTAQCKRCGRPAIEHRSVR